MVPVQFAAETFGIIWPLNQPDTALLFFPGALSPTDFPSQNSYPNLWWKRCYRWHPSSAENRASQPVIDILIRNWIRIKLAEALSRGSLFFVVFSMKDWAIGYPTFAQPYAWTREMFCCRCRHWNGQMRSLSCWTGRSPKWSRHTSRCPVKEGRQQTISR